MKTQNRFLTTIILVLATIALFTSCKKDDDPGVPTDLNRALVGTWVRTVDGAIGTQLKSETWVFNDGGNGGSRIRTFADNSQSVENITQWTVQGFSLVFKMDGESYTANVKIEGHNLYLTYKDGYQYIFLKQ